MFFGRKLIIISAAVIVVWMVFGVLIYHSTSINFFNSENNALSSNTKNIYEDVCKRISDHNFWQETNFRSDIPESIKQAVNDIEIHPNYTIIHDVKVHYLMSKPRVSKKLTILLLHGHSFSAETWNKIQTLHHLAALCFVTVALDIPGYGLSQAVEKIDKANFLHSTIQALNLKNVVVISPSMSGTYSIPYLVQYSSEIAGFIAVSPVNTNVLMKKVCINDTYKIHSEFDEVCQELLPLLKSQVINLTCLKVPTLIVFGEKDKGKNSARLCLLPNSHAAKISHGEHAAYLSNPNLWHKLLYNFLNILNESLLCGN